MSAAHEEFPLINPQECENLQFDNKQIDLAQHFHQKHHSKSNLVKVTTCKLMISIKYENCENN